MNGLVIAFKQSIFPVMLEVGTILTITSIIKEMYKVMRVSNWQQAITRMKDIFIAYAIVKGAFTLLDFIDSLIANIKI
jgi:hypothetical protein